ncbi:MAG: DUF4062 domain-containing protein [Bacteroidota bacterium]
MSDKLTVMVSSTSYDLKNFRQEVGDACLRAGTFPLMMEQLSARDENAIETSLKMVDEADVYVGIFAHRYGSIPKGHEISITHMEYDRAAERGIPILLFFIDDDVPVLPKDFDTGIAAEKLKTFKAELKGSRVAGFYKNKEDLRGLVLQSLSEYKAGLEQDQAPTTAKKAAQELNRLTAIPARPEPYIAHPYTLLQTRGLVGRKPELELLTDWITKPKWADIRIFNVVAIGGMGKSALTWKWFNEIAPQEVNFAGRIWWSFYESDASFANFLSHSLAYLSGQSLEEVKKLNLPEQQNALLRLLGQENHLIVLDGLERILNAYARMDAAYMLDDSLLDEQTANRVAGAYGLPESAGQSFVSKHQMRKTADIRAGQFLRRLARLKNSRILVSTRLYPADIQNVMGGAAYGCFPLFLEGLSDSDALELWREYGAKGSREAMLPVLHSFDKHPLLLQLLAYEVAGFREAPGDFDAWRKAKPEFDPFGMDLKQVQSHVLKFAMQGLSQAELTTLRVIAGFRMPANMGTVKGLLLQEEGKEKDDNQVFASLADLDQVLSSLEDRGLLGWDRKANRYDLHPIVRGVVWHRLAEEDKHGVHSSLRTHFSAIPTEKDYTKVESIEDLRPAIELYHSLIELGLYEEAAEVFRDRLSDATLYRLSASHLRVELLSLLFPEDGSLLPSLDNVKRQSYCMNALAQGYKFSGQLGKSIPLYRKANALDKKEKDLRNWSIGLSNLSGVEIHSGSLFQAGHSALQAIAISLELKDISSLGVGFQCLGSAFSQSGQFAKGVLAMQKALACFAQRKHKQPIGYTHTQQSQSALYQHQYQEALSLANQAWQLAHEHRNERDFIRAARLEGSAQLYLQDYPAAQDRLQHALSRARAVQLVEQELPTLTALAELHRRQGDPSKARDYLEDVWEAAERGPFPLLHADALNVLAQIEIDAGNTEAATAAATQAYQLAWCDGPPYAYHYGLENAKAHLTALGADFPDMPAFDESKFEPLPEVDWENWELSEGFR